MSTNIPTLSPALADRMVSQTKPQVTTPVISSEVASVDVSKQDSVPVMAQELKEDSVDLSTNAVDTKTSEETEVEKNDTEDQDKKGPIKKLKGFIANVKKFFSKSGIYIKGGAKGALIGGVAGSSVFGIGTIVNTIIDKAAKKSEQVAEGADEAIENAAKAVKHFPAKTLGALTAVGVLIASLWTASLDATQKGSDIEHRYVGHEK